MKQNQWEENILAAVSVFICCIVYCNIFHVLFLQLWIEMLDAVWGTYGNTWVRDQKMMCLDQLQPNLNTLKV